MAKLRNILAVVVTVMLLIVAWVKQEKVQTIPENKLEILTKLEIKNNVVKFVKLLPNNHELQITEFKNFSDLVAEVDKLDRTDKTRLAEIYSSSASLIRVAPVRYIKDFNDQLPQLLNSKLQLGFFAISAWIRYAANPAEVVLALLNYPRPEVIIRDYHHIPMNPMLAYDRLMAYSMRELRKRIGHENLVQRENNLLAELILEKNRHEKSLNTLIEAVQLLAIMKRTDLIQKIIETRNQRDQKILMAFI